MNKQMYYRTVSVIFLFISVLHVLRFAKGWEAVIAGVEIPLWASAAAALIAGYLAVRGWQFSNKRGR
jgi:hypothetical protein